MLLTSHCEEAPADIYWGALSAETVEHGGLLSTYWEWCPWIDLIDAYHTLNDPWHVTLFYDRVGDETYKQAFLESILDTTAAVTFQHIYVGNKGVAADVTPLYHRTWPRGTKCQTNRFHIFH